MMGRKKVAAEVVPEAPPFPDLLDYLWEYFGDVSLGIASSGMGPAQITWRDVAAWSDQVRIDLEPWEARAIVTLGLIRANVAAEAMASKTKTPEPSAPSGSPKKPRRR